MANSCGMLAIRAALIARGEGETRKRVLVPESAHGTNPATAAQCGFIIDEINAAPDGRVDLEAPEVTSSSTHPTWPASC